MAATPRIARAALHYWEEPVISGSGGSGTIFFVGCALGCIYCQNDEISQPSRASHGKKASLPGKEVDTDRLAHICLELEANGAHNINLVTATHHAPHVVAAIMQARELGLSIPVAFNTSGYELPATIDMLAPVVDIWLTDFKYADDQLANRYSRCADYVRHAMVGLESMRQQVERAGGRSLRADGTLRRGLVVRHLVLPDAIDNALDVLGIIYRTCGTDVDVSIMNQYTPTHRAQAFGDPLDRAVSEDEYESVLEYADELDFDHVWWQQGGTVSESFVPQWDGSGV